MAPICAVLPNLPSTLQEPEHPVVDRFHFSERSIRPLGGPRPHPSLQGIYQKCRLTEQMAG